MIENLPVYISVIFIIATLFTFALFIAVVKNANVQSTRKKTMVTLIGLIIWLTIQALLSANNIYNNNTNQLPPKIFLFGILPNFLLILFLFNTTKGKLFIDSLPLKYITILNVVRILVELVLFWLFVQKAVPELMTFSGRNFDIIAGITAPIVTYYGFVVKKWSNIFILLWNFICLGLLINIVINALLAAPSPIQQFAFDQPNIAILYFPFSWLPTFIVPIVFFGHLVSIRQLLNYDLKNSSK